MFRTLFRDLLGSPLDHWQRESIFINENDTNRKLEQQQKRLGEMNEIANRQAKDIQELRAAAERSVESAVEISRCAMEQRAREMSIRSDMRSPAANASEQQWRSALQDATEQQQRAISRGQQELRELASALQCNYEAQSRKQADEWKGVLKATNEAHKEAVTALQAQLQAQMQAQMQAVEHARCGEGARSWREGAVTKGREGGNCGADGRAAAGSSAESDLNPNPNPNPDPKPNPNPNPDPDPDPNPNQEARSRRRRRAPRARSCSRSGAARRRCARSTARWLPMRVRC